MVEEGSKRLLIDDLEPLHYPLAVQVVNDRQRKTSNVCDYIVELVGSLIEFFLVGLDDMGNILLGFQYHTVVRLVRDSDGPFVYRE